MFEQQVEGNCWKDVFLKKRIIWQHNGNPEMSHVVHPSTRAHCDTFFHSRLLAENPFSFSGVTLELTKKLLNYFWNEKPFEGEKKSVVRVVGVGENSITLAYDIARHLGAYWACKFAYTTRLPGYLAMSFPRDMPVSSLKGEHVLLCADEILTIADIESSVKAVQARDGETLPVVATIFNGSGIEEVNGKHVFSLVDHPVLRNDHCVLCEQGSEAINPYDAEKWNKLFID